MQLFFLVPWVIALIGLALHIFLDRNPARRTAPRVVELALLWVMVFFGAFAILGGLSHIGPTRRKSPKASATPRRCSNGKSAGVTSPSACWALRVEIQTRRLAHRRCGGIGDYVLGRRDRSHYEWQAHDNTAPNNVWAIPSDIVPLLAAILLVVYRRTSVKADAAAE